MSPDIVWIVGIIIIAIVAILVYLISVGRVTPDMLAKYGRMAAMAAEEAGRGNSLMTGQQKMQFAVDFMQKLLPVLNWVPDEVIIGVIQSFVLEAHNLSQQIKATESAPLPATPSVGLTGLGSPR